ncbi:hypothetical protein QBC39DRAFT_420587 [Podospora conica]|nr:hypothetical protein QBC39DRAFT_420587 [Schizothecium conicum]
MTTPVSDTEHAAYQPKHYHVLAHVMSRETSLAIFRRFEDLNYLRLMGLQAEIMAAKIAFEDRCKDDHGNNPRFSKSFRDLHLSRDSLPRPPSSDDGQPRPRSDLWQCSQLEILEHIDRKLSVYMSQVRSIRKPDKSQLKTLQNWLDRKDGGDGFLEGSEALVWTEDDLDEYACLAVGTETDIFTGLIRKLIVTLFPWFFRSKETKAVIEQSSGLRSYDDTKVNAASNMISVVISSTLPVLAIFVLDSRESTTDRLWLTVLFTAIFAAALGFFSSAKRAEIFAATATYVHGPLHVIEEVLLRHWNRFAAVEVVFIGTALGAENNTPAAPPVA